MSDDVKELANAVAEELAVEHCSFYGDKTSKAVKGFFLNQVYRSWGHTAHRGWARLLLDRRSLVQVPNAPRRRARADDRFYEENIMESYFHLKQLLQQRKTTLLTNEKSARSQHLRLKKRRCSKTKRALCFGSSFGST